MELDRIDKILDRIATPYKVDKNTWGWLPIIDAQKKLALQAIEAYIAEQTRIDENTSDGYHTFKELYEYRMLYNALLFNEWAKNGWYGVHKSKLHSDGEIPFGGGWFVVSAQLPAGQVTNHYELKDWDKFQVPENTRAAKWDGHTPQEAAQRLLDHLSKKGGVATVRQV